MAKLTDKPFDRVIALLHERAGLSPNKVSVIGLVIGLIAAVVVAGGFIVAGLLLMALAQIVDALDGGIARKYHLESARGALVEAVFDRISELAMFAALVAAGEVSAKMAALAFAAILLVTFLEPKSKFDPGFKRFMLYFGWLAGMLFPVRGFELAMQVIFLANLTVFAVGTVMVEYRLQKALDLEAIARRDALVATGAPLPPDDPPTILSKLFSWF